MPTESSDDSAELAARRGGAGDECGAEPSPMMQRLDERGARGIFTVFGMLEREVGAGVV